MYITANFADEDQALGIQDYFRQVDEKRDVKSEGNSDKNVEQTEL